MDPNKLEKYLNTRQTNMRHGAEESLLFWGVPKSNFPEGLPDDIREALMRPEDLAEAELIGRGQVDTEIYFVVDQNVARHRLK